MVLEKIKKICPELPGNELSKYVFKKFCTMSVAKMATKTSA
jgi:hypothetical protein